MAFCLPDLYRQIEKDNLKLCGVINIKHGWEDPYMGISMVKSLNMLN